MGGVVKIDDQSGFLSAWSAAIASAVTMPYYAALTAQDLGIGSSVLTLGDPRDDIRRFVRLSYDPVTDYLIVTNGLNWVANAAVIVGFSGVYFRAFAWAHTWFQAGSLNPASGWAASGANVLYYPFDGAGVGFSVDPNTRQLYQVWGSYLEELPRGSVSFTSRYPHPEVSQTITCAQSYGTLKILQGTFDSGALIAGFHVSSVLGEKGWASAFAQRTESWLDILATGWAAIIGNGATTWQPTPVILNDVLVTAFRGIISVVRRTTEAWLGTRTTDFGHVFAVCPVGRDSVLIIADMTTAGATIRDTLTNSLAAFLYVFDRSTNELLLMNVGIIPTSFIYTWPYHIGFMTVDSNRGYILLLSPDLTTVERYTFDTLGHPSRATALYAPAPLRPVHANTQVPVALLGTTGGIPYVAPDGVLSYGGTATAVFCNQPTMFTTDIKGIATVTLGLTSAASGATVSLTGSLSTFSVALCNTYTAGSAWGVTPVAILTASASFAVSTTVSTPGTVATSVTIQPRTPLSSVDTVGAGTPRELVYPTSALPSPLVYTMNPQVFTNLGPGDVYTRPLYASHRTLSKSATVQFQGDISDMQVEEKWLGGGNRIAMPLSFFSALWEYYSTPPDVNSAGFILWYPKDMNNHCYQVFITNLSVGGNEAVTLDHLARTGEGWVHEEVVMSLRIISRVS